MKYIHRNKEIVSHKFFYHCPDCPISVKYVPLYRFLSLFVKSAITDAPINYPRPRQATRHLKYRNRNGLARD